MPTSFIRDDALQKRLVWSTFQIFSACSLEVFQAVSPSMTHCTICNVTWFTRNCHKYSLLPFNTYRSLTTFSFFSVLIRVYYIETFKPDSSLWHFVHLIPQFQQQIILLHCYFCPTRLPVCLHALRSDYLAATTCCLSDWMVSVWSCSPTEALRSANLSQHHIQFRAVLFSYHLCDSLLKYCCSMSISPVVDSTSGVKVACSTSCTRWSYCLAHTWM